MGLYIAVMAFFQTPPELGNQFDEDALLQEYVDRKLPAEIRPEFIEELRHLGAMSGGELYRASLEDRHNEPRLTQWDPWGHRIDEIEITPLWKRAEALTAEHGFVATGYRKIPQARLQQFIKNYTVQASLDVYSCPLAMTDGAAKTLLESQNAALIDRALPRLTSSDPSTMWTSGQWMTERTGGSDVGISETEARETEDGWRLYGTKWFTSATTSQMALTLGRPQGNPSGGRGLALFYVETRNDEGRLNNIRINRLKDKLGTRKVPTAELSLEGTLATPVIGLENGIKNISHMLNVTRVWNSAAAAWGARRAVALARSYAHKRTAFRNTLIEKPLHIDTLAQMAAEQEAIFQLSFRAIELLGKIERGEANELEQRLLRLLTPIVKLTTAKQAVAVASEALEAFGGAGYVEDTGLPHLLRDAQVLPIWEGTTNVLSLDTLKVLMSDGALEALQAEVRSTLASVHAAELSGCVQEMQRGVNAATEWVQSTLAAPLPGAAQAEAGARRFALTLGRTLQLGLMTQHAQWCLDQGRGARAAAAARRFAQHGVVRVDPQISADDAKLLALG